MKYMGSKNRIAKDIIPIILENRDKYPYYVEPFVGGCNMIDKIEGYRIGFDINPYLIEMWKLIQNNNTSLPLEISKELYDKARNHFNNKTADSYFSVGMIGWIGFMASFNGRFFDGGYSGHNVNGRNYIGEQIKNTLAQSSKIKDVIFITKSFNDIVIPMGQSIVYCDPPYKNSKQYAYSKNFNYDLFWNWVRKKSLQGNEVFVSEYDAPEDFECVWQKEVTNSLNPTKTIKATEKLFKYKIK